MATVSRPVAIRARDLSIHYRSNRVPQQVVAVSGINLEVAEGEILGLVGESGAGKSTLAMALAGLAGPGRPGSGRPQICGGTLSVLGTRMRGLGPGARDRVILRVGFLEQDGAGRLNSEFTVAENVAEPIFRRDRKFSPRLAADAVAYLVDALHLPLSVMDRMPWELSSGQRQRAALARALILEPALLIADEPTRGVDASVRDGVLEALRELQRERSFGAVIISSDLAVATSIADRLAVMQSGMIVGLGTPEQVFDAPTHPYVKRLARVKIGS